MKQENLNEKDVEKRNLCLEIDPASYQLRELEVYPEKINVQHYLYKTNEAHMTELRVDHKQQSASEAHDGSEYTTDWQLK